MYSHNFWIISSRQIKALLFIRKLQWAVFYLGIETNYKAAYVICCLHYVHLIKFGTGKNTLD
jgi:hypothetical protein